MRLTTPLRALAGLADGSDLRERAQELLAQADVELDGEAPWDPQVHDDRMFRRVFAEGNLGLGESYMEGWWDCEALDEFVYRVQKADLHGEVRGNLALWTSVAKAKVVNLQSGDRAWEVGEQHYDLGNDLYGAMLDERMNYSCAYWRDADTLDEAQEAKLDLVCRKLKLEPGMRVLDIGCGWGSFAEWAAENYDAEVVGLTVSEEQARSARRRCKGLDVDVRLRDYRELDEPAGSFDRVVSIGMFEHVGRKNYRTFMEVAHEMLREGGLQMLHTIGTPVSRDTADPWITKYIFPNSMLPSLTQIGEAAEGLFVVEDVHNFGQDYDPTLMAWYQNVEDAWDELGDDYDETFRRMWRYYLLSCAGSFRARAIQLWQVVLAKDRGVEGGYEPVR